MKLIWLNVLIVAIVLLHSADAQNKSTRAPPNFEMWRKLGNAMMASEKGKGDKPRASVLNNLFGKLKVDKKFGNLQFLNKRFEKAKEEPKKSDATTIISINSIVATQFTLLSFWMLRNFC